MSTIYEIFKRNSITVSSKKRLVKPEESFARIHPELLPEFDFKKSDFSPEEVSYGSTKIAHWICSKCTSSYEMMLKERHKGKNCPYCRGQKVNNTNSLAALRPDLALEWADEYNRDLTPNDVTSSSHKKVYWKCLNCKKVWLSTVKNRNNGTECPYCKGLFKSSFPQEAIYNYIHKLFPDSLSRYKIGGVEVDIFIPSQNLGIEYDGYYHKGVESESRDKAKNYIMYQNKVTLIRIREKGLNPIDVYNCLNFLRDSHSHSSLLGIIKKLMENFKKTLPLSKEQLSIIDEILSDSTIKYEELYKKIRPVISAKIRGNALLYTRPDLAKQWDYNKNNNLKPDLVTPGSGQVAWWICDKGHSFKTKIATRQNHGCPYCGNFRALPGYNSLSTIRPDLIAEWDYAENNNLRNKWNEIITPETVLPKSHYMVHWICKNDESHRWIARIADRLETGCPYCRSKKREV